MTVVMNFFKKYLREVIAVALAVVISLGYCLITMDDRYDNFINSGATLQTYTLSDMTGNKDFTVYGNTVHSDSEDPYFEILFDEPVYIDSISYDMMILHDGRNSNKLYMKRTPTTGYSENDAVEIPYRDGYILDQNPIGEVVGLRLDLTTHETGLIVFDSFTINFLTPTVQFDICLFIALSFVLAIIFIVLLILTDEFLIPMIKKRKIEIKFSKKGVYLLSLGGIFAFVGIVYIVYFAGNVMAANNIVPSLAILLPATVASYIAAVCIYKYVHNFNLRAVLLMLLFGTIVCFVNPPFQVPDENRHFYRTYAIGMGNFDLKSEEPDMPKSMDYAQNAFPAFFYDVNYQNFNGSVFEAFSYYHNEVNDDWETGDTYTRYSTYTKSDIPHILPYIPGAIGVALTRLVTTDALVAFYVARMFSLFFYLACCYLALRNITRFKNIFLAIMFLPMSLSLAASTSYDMMLTALSILFASFCFKNEVRLRDFVIMLALYASLNTIKYAYLPLILLIYLIPKENWKIKIPRTFMIAGAGIVAIAAIMLWDIYIANFSHMVTEENMSTSNPVSSISWYYHNFIFYARMILKTFYSRILDVYLDYLSSFGWLNIYLVLASVFTPFCLFMAAVMDGKDTVRGKRLFNDLFYTAVLFGATFLAVCTGLYGAFSGLGANSIEGVQGRYFIPVMIAPMIFIALLSGKLLKVEPTPKMRDNFTLLSFTALSGVTYIELFARYFIG